jgi:purine-binding chemotaxis protein CheW
LSVKEVIALPDTTPIPQTPPYFLGIMNLRGQVISVIDLRTKLNIKPSDSTEVSVIICDLSPNCIGVVVDSINCVLYPSFAEISEKPEIQNNAATEYITNVYRRENQLVLFLDIGRTLSGTDHRLVASNPLSADRKGT